MAVLTAERSITRHGAEQTGTPPVHKREIKATVKVWKGSLVATDATGYAVVGAAIAATGLIIWGIAEKTVDNTSGASGALSVDCRCGEFLFGNLGGDPVTQADVGKAVYAEDDTQIRRTSNTSTRSAAGVFVGFADDGVSAIVRVGNLSQTGV